MKKIVRVIIRSIITAIILIGIILIINWTIMSNINDITKIFIFIVLIGIAIFLGVSLMSNPDIKLNLFKTKIKNVKRKKSTLEFKEICGYLMNQYGNELEEYRKAVLKYVFFLILFLILDFFIVILFSNFLNFDYFKILRSNIYFHFTYITRKNLEEKENF